MKLFMPKLAIFEPKSLEYPLGMEIYNSLKSTNVETIIQTARNASQYIEGTTPAEKYANSKKTILFTANNSKELDVCKPSADFQFALTSNCPGNCEYCYLQTTQGTKPYIKVFVNIEDIFSVIVEHIEKNQGKITSFEVASLGDPLALEHITNSLAKTIKFFSVLEKGRLRVVTKYSNVESLLNIDHNQHTHFRISINSNYVIDNFEHNTCSLDERVEAIKKLSYAGYPIGFIVAPIMIYENWKKEYEELFNKLQKSLGTELSNKNLTFELIQHRYTAVAKELILQRFPKTKIDMQEENRSLKWGRFGRYKYVYPKEQSQEIKQYISSVITNKFTNARIEYFT